MQMRLVYANEVKCQPCEVLLPKMDETENEPDLTWFWFEFIQIEGKMTKNHRETVANFIVINQNCSILIKIDEKCKKIDQNWWKIQRHQLKLNQKDQKWPKVNQIWPNTAKFDQNWQEIKSNCTHISKNILKWPKSMKMCQKWSKNEAKMTKNIQKYPKSMKMGQKWPNMKENWPILAENPRENSTEIDRNHSN